MGATVSLNFVYENQSVKIDGVSKEWADNELKDAIEYGKVVDLTGTDGVKHVLYLKYIERVEVTASA